MGKLEKLVKKYKNGNEIEVDEYGEAIDDYFDSDEVVEAFEEMDDCWFSKDFDSDKLYEYTLFFDYPDEFEDIDITVAGLYDEDENLVALGYTED